MIYKFDIWGFNTNTGELYRLDNTASIKRLGSIEGKVLVYLIEHQGQWVTYDTLCEECWSKNTSGVTIGTPMHLKSVIKKIRSALGESAKDERFIKNGRFSKTYCFIPEVIKSQAHSTSPVTTVQLSPDADDITSGNADDIDLEKAQFNIVPSFFDFIITMFGILTKFRVLVFIFGVIVLIPLSIILALSTWNKGHMVVSQTVKLRLISFLKTGQGETKRGYPLKAGQFDVGHVR